MPVVAMTETATRQTPRRFEMTERDIDCLAFLARVRFATADQIIRFTAGSEKNVGNRIRLLYWHGYIARVDDQQALIRLFHLLGNTAPVYGLARAGTQLLAARNIFPAKVRAKAPLIPHTVAATEFVLACALASRRPDAPRLIHQSDLLVGMPASTRALERPFRFRVPYQENFKTLSLNADPDIMFSLLYADNFKHNFCVEVDLKSETIAKRHDGKIIFGKSTFARKQAAYFLGWKEGRHREQWAWPGFRVLTVTPSERRIVSMLDAQAEVARSARNMFLYTTPERIKKHGAFANIWTSAERDNISIIER